MGIMATKAMAIRMETWGVCIREPELAEELASSAWISCTMRLSSAWTLSIRLSEM